MRRLLRAEKAGHCGTLDPFAEGVLPIALGEATKTIRWLAAEAKEYDFTVKWGAATDSGDKSGEITEAGAKIPDPEEIKAALPAFVGEIMQAPPPHSAVKVGGERAYRLTRAGKPPQLAPRPVSVKELALTAHEAGRSRFSCRCGGGTYIRSLAVDLAKRIKSLCYVESLVRTAVGDFKLADAITLDFLDSMGHSELAAAVQPIAAVLKSLPVVEISPHEALLLARGVGIGAARPLGGLCRAECDGRLVAIAEGDERCVLRPMRVFNSWVFDS